MKTMKRTAVVIGGGLGGLATAVRLAARGWRVEVCADGSSALSLIEGGGYYDLLLLDNQLPGASGLELARRARELPHRRHTPIIVISASEVEREARSAGADAFLRKPQDVGLIVGTVEGLIRRER